MAIVVRANPQAMAVLAESAFQPETAVVVLTSRVMRFMSEPPKSIDKMFEIGGDRSNSGLTRVTASRQSMQIGQAGWWGILI